MHACCTALCELLSAVPGPFPARILQDFRAYTGQKECITEVLGTDLHRTQSKRGVGVQYLALSHRIEQDDSSLVAARDHPQARQARLPSCHGSSERSSLYMQRSLATKHLLSHCCETPVKHCVPGQILKPIAEDLSRYKVGMCNIFRETPLICSRLGCTANRILCSSCSSTFTAWLWL